MNYTLKSLLASLLTSVGLVGVCAPPSFATAPPLNPWDTTYENSPAAGDAVNQGDDWIRQLKTDLRTKLQVEHQIGNFYSGSAQDNALHRVGSARCFFSDAAPTKLGGPEMQSGTVIKDIDRATGAAASGNTHLLTTAETNGADDEVGSGVARKVGYGRCWIDVDGPDNVTGNYDDYSLYVYNGTDWSVPWFPNKPNSGNNLLPDGGFEGNPVDTTLASCVDPSSSATAAWVPAATTNTPIGWRCVATGSTNQVANVAVDAEMGQGYGIQVKANGATAKGIWIQLELKELTTYTIAAQVKATASDDVCKISIDSPPGSSDELVLSHTGNTSHTYLQGNFTTNGADPTTEVILTATADQDICTFDNIRLVESGATSTAGTANVASSGSFYWYKEATSAGTVAPDGTSGTDIITSPTFKVNAPNCTYIVKGTTNIRNVDAVGHWGTDSDAYYDFGALAANTRILTNGATSAVNSKSLCANGVLTNVAPGGTEYVGQNPWNTNLYCSMVGFSGSYYYPLDTFRTASTSIRVYNTGISWGTDTRHVEHTIVNPPPGTTYQFKLNAAISYDPPGSHTLTNAFLWCGGDCNAGGLGDVSGFPPNRLSVQAICPGD